MERLASVPVSACQHKDFAAYVSVGRLGEMPKDGRPEEELDPHSFVAEVKIKCTECGEPFGFKGIAGGYNLNTPTQSVDGLQAHLPLRTPAEMKMAGALAGMDPESRRVARGFRMETKAAEEGAESALMDAVRQRTDGWVTAYKEARANGMDDADAQMHADFKMREEFDGPQ